MNIDVIFKLKNTHPQPKLQKHEYGNDYGK